ncbi:MAG: hypothetical protein QOG01_3044, partial [Pseudonocardiales bacterium]|nr:hypothetical protein [Pseudonocardiales bacterium]
MVNTVRPGLRFSTMIHSVVRPLRPLLTVVSLSVLLFVVVVTRPPSAEAIGSTPLTSGSLTMVSTHADGTSGTNPGTTEGANEVAISDDGSVVAFTSTVPAEELVTDPLQVGHVTDNNTGSGGPDSGLDVFVYQKLPVLGAIVSLVSSNASHTGTGNAPSTTPVLAPLGIGLVFRSAATDLVTGSVAASQRHLYAWVPGLSALTSVFLIDNKFGTHDACDCIASDPSISMFPTPTVVFDATASGTDLAGPGVAHQGADQVYANNVLAGTNSLVSVDINGDGVIGGATEPMIAADAPIVVFTSTGDDLVAGFTSSNGSNIWERNLLTSSTSLISASQTGDPSGTTGNHDPVISSLGNGVAWSSNDPDVSATPFFNAQQSTDHIFYRAILPVKLPTLMVDTGVTGLLGCDANSNNPGISGDGLSVVFESSC